MPGYCLKEDDCVPDLVGTPIRVSISVVLFPQLVPNVDNSVWKAAHVVLAKVMSVPFPELLLSSPVLLCAGSKSYSSFADEFIKQENIMESAA